MRPIPAIVFALALLPPMSAAAPLDERQLDKEVLVEAPLDEVGKAWTTSEGLVSFFAPEAVVEARPGGAFSIHFNPTPPPGLTGAEVAR